MLNVDNNIILDRLNKRLIELEICYFQCLKFISNFDQIRKLITKINEHLKKTIFS